MLAPGGCFKVMSVRYVIHFLAYISQNILKCWVFLFKTNLNFLCLVYPQTSHSRPDRSGDSLLSFYELEAGCSFRELCPARVLGPFVFL